MILGDRTAAVLAALALAVAGLALNARHGHAAGDAAGDAAGSAAASAAASAAGSAVIPASLTEADAVADGLPAEGADTPPVHLPGRGSVTNLPLPRFVSLKTDEGNARRGPSLTHRIDWVFKHRNMPLRVTAEFGHWRRVEDSDGQGGWVHYSMLSGVRTVVVDAPMADLHLKPGPDTPVMARAEAGAIARLGDCDADWCRISADGERGWVRKADIWGVDPAETRD